jgi:hypothetical protein
MRPAYIRDKEIGKTSQMRIGGISGIAAKSIAKENHGKLAPRISDQELNEPAGSCDDE